MSIIENPNPHGKSYNKWLGDKAKPSHREQLRMMKKGAYLINMGRGGIVNEEALAVAIDEGVIAGAAVDVFVTEPLPSDHPYLKVKNRDRLVLSPHVAWASREARTLLVDIIAENIRNYVSEKNTGV